MTPGLNTCGINAPYFFKRFLEGVVANVKRPRQSKRRPPRVPAAACVTPLTWVQGHMAGPLSSESMEQARGSGMRYLLEAIDKHTDSGPAGPSDRDVSRRLDQLYPESR